MRVSLAIVLVCACGGAPMSSPDDAGIDTPGAIQDAGVDAPASPLSFDPPALEFGYVEPNTSSPPLHLAVINSGPLVTDFALALTGDDAAEFLIGQSTCTSSLGAGCD